MNSPALLNISLPILLFLVIACNKDTPELKHKVIADGCVPEKIVFDLDTLGGFEDHYQYEGLAISICKTFIPLT